MIFESQIFINYNNFLTFSTNRLYVISVENRYENVVVTKFDQKMDEDEFRSSMFQRPYQYLQRYMTNQELRGIHADTPQGNPRDCIQMLLR